MATKKEIGDGGERAVCSWLRAHGYEILARNYRTDHGEIDIIAKDENTLVFCEVKTRRDGDQTRFGRPARAVDAEKRTHLRYAAHRYLMEAYGDARPPCGLVPRMDVAEVLYSMHEGQISYRVRYIPRAFGKETKGEKR